MNLADYLNKTYILLLAKTVDRIDKILDDGTEIKMYWVGPTIRIDIRPPQKETRPESPEHWRRGL